jgi:hypothetical protein
MRKPLLSSLLVGCYLLFSVKLARLLNKIGIDCPIRRVLLSVWLKSRLSPESCSIDLPILWQMLKANLFFSLGVFHQYLLKSRQLGLSLFALSLMISKNFPYNLI